MIYHDPQCLADSSSDADADLSGPLDACNQAFGPIRCATKERFQHILNGDHSVDSRLDDVTPDGPSTLSSLAPVEL